MTLSTKIDLARAVFGTDREPAQTVTRVTGIATADSDDGTVFVTVGDGEPIEAGCIGAVSEGDLVTVHVQGGDAQVIGADGWGDAIAAATASAVASATIAEEAAESAVESATEASESAQSAGVAAAVAQAAAEAAQGDIDEMENWFYHDTLGAHVLGNTDGYRTDVSSTGMQVVDTTDQQPVVAVSADGGQFGKTDGFHLVLLPTELSFRDALETRVAYIEVDSETGDSMFYVTNAVVVDDLRFGGGDWQWYARGSGNLALKWMGGAV